MTNDNSYDPEFAEMIGGYPAGAVVRSDTGACRYRSVVDNNTDYPNPGSDKWRTLFPKRTRRLVNLKRYGRLFVESFLSALLDWRFYSEMAAVAVILWLLGIRF